MLCVQAKSLLAMHQLSTQEPQGVAQLTMKSGAEPVTWAHSQGSPLEVHSGPQGPAEKFSIINCRYASY